MDAECQREWAEYQRYREWVEMAEMVHDGTMLDEESYYGKNQSTPDKRANQGNAEHAGVD